MTKLSVVFLSLVSTSSAFADPTGAQAQTLFTQAKALVKSGKLAEACAAFDASQKLEPATSTLVNLADCREKNQQYATAWGLYLQAERELRALTDDSSIELRALVKTRAGKLEPRLSTLAIRVPSASLVSALEIIRDNDRVEPGAWNQALPVDGGTYKISARAPDRREWTTTVIVRPEHDVQSVDVPALGSSAPAPVAMVTPPRAAPASTPLAVAPAPVSARPPADRAPPHRASLVLPVSFGVAALALGGAALGVQASASSTYDDAKAATDRTSQLDLLDSANHRRYLAEGLGAAAVVSAGAAVFFYVRGRHAESQPRAPGLALAPLASPSLAGLALAGRF